MENTRTLQDIQKGALEEYIENLNDKIEGMSISELEKYKDSYEYQDIISEDADGWVPIHIYDLRKLYCDDGFEISEGLDNLGIDLSTDIDTNIRYGIYGAICDYINEHFDSEEYLQNKIDELEKWKKLEKLEKLEEEEE